MIEVYGVSEKLVYFLCTKATTEDLDITDITRQNMFAITRFRHIEDLFHIFYYSWGKKIFFAALYRGLLYIEVSYIEVTRYLKKSNISTHCG